MTKENSVFNIKKTEAEILSSFPELKGKLFFLEPNKNTNLQKEVEGLSNRIGQVLPKLLDPDTAVSYFKDVSPALEHGTALAIHFYEKSEIAGHKYIAAQFVLSPMSDATYSIQDGKIEPNFADDKELSLEEEKNNDMIKSVILDHEIGHVLSRNEVMSDKFKDLDERNFSESVADAYALIMHYKRFGSDSDFAQSFIDIRFDSTSNYGNSSYDTVQVLKEIVRLNNEIDLSKVSIKEAVEIAIDISRQNVLLKPDNELDSNSKYKKQTKKTI